MILNTMSKYSQTRLLSLFSAINNESPVAIPTGKSGDKSNTIQSKWYHNKNDWKSLLKVPDKYLMTNLCRHKLLRKECGVGNSSNFSFSHWNIWESEIETFR